MATKDYLSCAETAKLVRKALRANFPELPARFFSVRSDTYSGGASIDVSWMDGPTVQEVREVTALYEGSTFDGMQDLKTPHSSILTDENGELREVHFGADFIFTHRDHSLELAIAAEERCRDRYPDFPGPDELELMTITRKQGTAFMGALPDTLTEEGYVNELLSREIHSLRRDARGRITEAA